MKKQLILLAITLLFTSCATQNILTPSADKQNINLTKDAFNFNSTYEYRLRKDDKINISIWDHDDLSVGSIYGIYNSNEIYGKWLMLDLNGDVSVPKIGNVHLKGLTVSEAKEALKTAFSKWIVDPIVEVKVLNKKVTILGELKTPGEYTLEKDDNTLLEMVGLAGDFDFYANKKKIQVIRKENGITVTKICDLTKVDQQFSENTQIHPGDVIYVPSRKGKHWDKRAGSTIVPIASAISTAVLILSLLK